MAQISISITEMLEIPRCGKIKVMAKIVGAATEVTRMGKSNIVLVTRADVSPEQEKITLCLPNIRVIIMKGKTVAQMEAVTEHISENV